MVSGVGQYAEPVPGRTTVEAEHASVHLHLQRGKSFTHHGVESWSTQDFQLLFRIVQVVDINAVEPEVISTAFDLIIQKLRSETVTAADDVGWFHHTALEVLAGEKFVISLLRCRWSFLERDVSALGA